MNIYQQRILDEYHNPQNTGKPDNYTHSAKLENHTCGDVTEVFLSVEGDSIKDVHHITEGCAICVASASIISQELKNKSVTEIKSLGAGHAEELLGIHLTPSRQKCAELPLEAVKDALSK